MGVAFQLPWKPQGSVYHNINIKTTKMWFWSQSVVKPAASSTLKVPGLEYLATSLGVKERTLVKILVPSLSLLLLLLSSVIFVVINARNSAASSLPEATALLDKEQLASSTAKHGIVSFVWLLLHRDTEQKKVESEKEENEAVSIKDKILQLLRLRPSKEEARQAEEARL